MSSNTLNPNASVTVALQGLAVCCHNESFNNNRGRWEIALPRFADHSLTVEITGIGVFAVEQGVKLIEIKDRGSLPAKPTHETDEAMDRTDPQKNSNDFRWVTNMSTDFSFTVGEPITKDDDSKRVDVTMLYVHDATAYTKSLDTSMLIRTPVDATAPLVNGEPKVLPKEKLVSALDGIKDSLFEAGVMGLDIESDGGDALDIFFDGVKSLTIPHGAEPQQILIRNLEPGELKDESRFADTGQAHYGLGDFYRYYKLFNIEGQKVHQWGKQPKTPSASGPNRDCCCNMAITAGSNLDGLA
jgi:hypothetical protein